jgi:hypothetical protein
MALEELEDARPVHAPEREDPANEPPVDEVGDAVAMQAAAVAEPPLQDPPEARHGTAINEDDCVRAREPFVERSEPHRVDHPLVLRDQSRMRLLPPWSEVVSVDHRQAERLAQPASEDRLARAAAADHGDPAHQAEAAAALSRGSLRETIWDTPSPPIVTP